MKKVYLFVCMMIFANLLVGGPPRPPSPYNNSSNPPTLENFRVVFRFNGLNNWWEALLYPQVNDRDWDKFILHVVITRDSYYFYCAGDESWCKVVGSGKSCERTPAGDEGERWCYLP